VHGVLGDLQGAAQYLADGLRINPNADELRGPLAELLDRLGRSEEAQRVRNAEPATPTGSVS
jgi:thioredoxin-like negative regulator of GroEL